MTNANLAQKTPIARSLNALAIRKAQDQIELLGRALPASVVAVSGSIVTVNFEIQSSSVTLPNITIPKAESQWFRAPTQVGDHGLVIPSDVSLGAVSGLGGTSAATLSLVPNLSALAWIPIASADFSASPDANSAFVNGPDGVIFQDAAGHVVGKVDKNAGTFTISIGGTVVFTVNASGVIVPGSVSLGGDILSQSGSTYAGNIVTSGEVTAKSGTSNIALSALQVSGVQSGSQNSGPPVPNT